MGKIYYNKLCRDNIPDIIADKGFECEVRPMDEDEYREELVKKIREEANGVSHHVGRSSLIKEISDLLIAIDALKQVFTITDEELDEAIEKNLSEKGGYEDMLYLEWSSDTSYRSRDHASEDDE